jgi:hypothetical protein
VLHPEGHCIVGGSAFATAIVGMGGSSSRSEVWSNRTAVVRNERVAATIHEKNGNRLRGLKAIGFRQRGSHRGNDDADSGKGVGSIQGQSLADETAVGCTGSVDSFAINLVVLVQRFQQRENEGDVIDLSVLLGELR